jgi:hypothetical protein
MPAKSKSTAKSKSKSKAGSHRELIAPKGDKRYVRRKADGTFGKMVDVSKSLSADRRRTAKKKVAKGQGDRGDTKR